MIAWPHRIKGCIFDNDGTLVDTGSVYAKAHYLTTGQKQTPELKIKLSGVSYLEGSRITVKECNLDETPEHYAKRFEETIEKLLVDIPLMPGVMKVTTELKNRGVKMCIATGATSNCFKRKVSNHIELTQLMDHFVTGDDVAHGKPFPDLFLKALDKWNSDGLNINNEEALVFEDSPLGIKAANKAGIPAIFIPDGIVDIEKVLNEYDAHPLMTIKSLDDFDFTKFKWGFSQD